MSEAVINANGSGAAQVEEPEVIRAPTSEAEANEFFRRRLGNDPAAMRAAADETARRLYALADQAEAEARVAAGAGASTNGGALVGHANGHGHALAASQVAAPTSSASAESTPVQEDQTPGRAEVAVTAPVSTAPVSTATTPTTSAPTAPAAVPATAPVPPAATAPAAPAPTQVQTPAPAPAPRRPAVEVPPGYQTVPEGAHVWSPESWGGAPLHCVPKQAMVREGRSTLLLCVLLEPAFARSRSGRMASLPRGAKVVVHVNTAWAPVAPLAAGPGGRPVIFATPMTMDKSTTPPRLRLAQPGEELYRFSTGDGGWEYGLSITFDPDPNDPSRPRLIALDVLEGADKP